jgi:hypothetical protein
MSEPLIFEWIKNEKNSIYESKKVAFKIKKEKIVESDMIQTSHGYEVYIADDKLKKEWKPFRIFPDDRNMGDIMRWVERFAEQLSEKYREEA